MIDLYPIAFLPKDHALAIAIMSYDGQLNFGLLGDYDALPDIDALAGYVRGAIDELLDVARSRVAAGNGSGNGRVRTPVGSGA